MIFSNLKRWFTRTKTTNRRTDGSENLFVVPAAAGAAVAPTDNDSDDAEAVEGDAVDTGDFGDSTGGDASCGASCGASG